jgi:membrane fusion protein (multidrug efflux system)
MKRTMTRILTAIVFSILLSACRSAEVDTPSPARPVVIGQVLGRDLEVEIVASGQLLAKQRAVVAAQVGGEITQIRVDEGGAVAAGTAVIEIDPERRHLDLDRARARAAEARATVAEQQRELARVEALARQDIASQTQLERAQTALQTARARLLGAEADLGSAERALRDATVTASFDGLVARRHVSAGEFVQPGNPLFELVSLDPIEVELHVPEADSSRVALGQPLAVRVAPYPDEIFQATVSVVSPTIDPDTRTLRVKALLPNPDHRLRPGLFARTSLGIESRKAVAMVPEESVLQRASGSVVFRVVDGTRAERRIIETGVIRDGWVEVRKGLSVGDAIVLRGHGALTDGSPIVERRPDGTAANPSHPVPDTAGLSDAKRFQE